MFWGRMVLAPTTAEDITGEGHSYSNKPQENGMWSALNPKEPITTLVRSSPSRGAPPITWGSKSLNLEEQQTAQQQRNDVILSIRGKCMEKVVKVLQNYAYRKCLFPQTVERLRF